MNMRFLLSGLLIFVLTKCDIQKQVTGDYIHKTECLGARLDGSQTLKTWGNGRNRFDAIEQGKKNAVRDVLFLGIIDGKTDCEKKPVISEVNAQEKYESYFNKFFADDGEYKNYVSSKDERIGRKQLARDREREESRGGVTHGLVVKVYRAALKQKMIDDKILNSGTQPAVPPVPEPPKKEENILRGSGDPLKGLNLSKAKSMVIGNYYALIIGIDNYTGTWTKLNNAVSDAKAVEALLRSTYKLDHCKTLYNEAATRNNIIAELESLTKNVKETDNVIIYYSGHGEFKKEYDKGYWVPSDATSNTVAAYISNNDLQAFLVGIKSKHTLLISDACFSGDVMRGNTVTIPFEESEKYYNTVHDRNSRKAITSGSIEPVMDGGKDGHSVFSYYLLRTLSANTNKFFDASQLYEQLKIPVINNSDQTPLFNAIKNTGDEGGQFIFIKK